MMIKKKTGSVEAHSPILADIVDRRRGSIYDRICCAGGGQLPSLITLFQYPVGSGNPSRTFADTNMYNGGRFNPPQDMIVERFLFLIQPSVSEEDRNRFVANYRWEFRVLEKTLNQEPLLRAAAVGKPEDLIPEFGQTRNKLEGEGSRLIEIGNRVCWDLEKYEVYIAPLMYFQVALLADEPMVVTSDFDMYVIVEGLRDFAVL